MSANITEGFLIPYGDSDRARAKSTNDCCTYQNRDNRAATFVYPELSPPPIEIITNVTANTYGDYYVVVPNNTIPNEWRIVDIHISVAQQKDEDYILSFHRMDNDGVVMTTKCRQNNVISSSTNHYCQSSPISGNVGVKVKAAITLAGAKSIKISVIWKYTGAA